MANDLTENEGTLLGVVMRLQPVTAYQVLRTFETSPVGGFNNSKGAVYPIIRRLKARGLLVAERVVDDGRRTETLACTDAGAEAVKAWVKDLQDVHSLVFDPMRTRMLSLDLLSREEQIEWIVDAKRLIEAKQEEVGRYREDAKVPFPEVVYEASQSALGAKSAWLDRLMYEVVKGKS